MENTKQAILASFIGDAFAMGAHWIYDTRLIEKEFGRIEEFIEPLESSYHYGKHKGEQTHYGDQMAFLLESVNQNKGFFPEKFAIEWQEKIKDYKGYIDFASKKTLSNLNSGGTWRYSGSSSDELGGCARIAPLLLIAQNKSSLLEDIRMQTIITHNSPFLLQICDFLIELIIKIMEGKKPSESIPIIIQQKKFKKFGEQYITPVLNGIGNSTRIEIKRFGQMCSGKNAFPSLIHLIVKYEDDPKEGMIENVMAGGDSAARGLLFGLMMGLLNGTDWIPESWMKQLHDKNRIEQLMVEVKNES